MISTRVFPESWNSAWRIGGVILLANLLQNLST
jgi:hypothetical protein